VGKLKRFLDEMKRKKGMITSRYPEPYQVEFHYTMGPPEVYKVTARSFKEALVRGLTLKQKRMTPKQYKIIKIKA